MPKLIDLLTSLGKKSKLDLAKPEFKAVLDASKDVDVPQEFADQLETSLMTVDAALSNQDVRKRIQAEVLNGEDSYLNGIITDLDIDDATKELIKGEKDTRARIRKTITSLNEEKKKAKKSGDTVTEEALKNQVADLNKQLKAVKEGHTSEIQKLQADRDNDFINYELMGQLGVKNYALPEQMSAKQKVKTALLSVQEALAQKNLKVVKTAAGVELQKADGTAAYDDKNTLLELPSFIDGVLASSGLLKNSDSSQGNNSQQQNSQHFNTGGNGQQPVVNTAFLGELDKAIAGQIN